MPGLNVLALQDHQIKFRSFGISWLSGNIPGNWGWRPKKLVSSWYFRIVLLFQLNAGPTFSLQDGAVSLPFSVGTSQNCHSGESSPRCHLRIWEAILLHFPAAAAMDLAMIVGGKKNIKHLPEGISHHLPDFPNI